ncbi:hypothetical protein HC931_12715 [Candidatus Gracilibacteria bacterium]|nr:hypothetical protein [Candidatus Gracilibacteria bacterium]NJM86811.1 hypothetical protein [Hydrococcus sp. RU_2_2]NJP17756.1 hypothetical protein [Hydrococcus sp. CRU_1_1]
MLTQQKYHGWVITLIPEHSGYLFECSFDEAQIKISDRNIYPTATQALKAAYRKADLEAAGLALIRFLNEIYGRCYYLTSNDHIALTSSILEFLK